VWTSDHTVLMANQLHCIALYQLQKYSRQQLVVKLYSIDTTPQQSQYNIRWFRVQNCTWYTAGNFKKKPFWWTGLASLLTASHFPGHPIISPIFSNHMEQLVPKILFIIYLLIICFKLGYSAIICLYTMHQTSKDQRSRKPKWLKMLKSLLNASTEWLNWLTG